MRRAARAVLVAAVRGRRDQGDPWGEAALAELDQTRGRWEALRWTAGALRVVWQERRARLKAQPRGVRVQRAVMVAAVLALPAMFLVNQFVVTARYLPSGAMEPTLLIADRLLVDKASFHFTGIRYGDIVEFDTPAVPHSIKRVIGLPGDTIECRDNRIFRDGLPLDEPYLTADYGQTQDCGAPTTVPPGHLYVLGDHRLVSQDSRTYGPIPESAVDGRLLTTIWPIRHN